MALHGNITLFHKAHEPKTKKLKFEKTVNLLHLALWCSCSHLAVRFMCFQAYHRICLVFNFLRTFFSFSISNFFPYFDEEKKNCSKWHFVAFEHPIIGVTAFSAQNGLQCVPLAFLLITGVAKGWMSCLFSFFCVQNGVWTPTTTTPITTQQQ